MANVLNRATKEYRASVNTPDFDVSSWIINPDLSAVVGFASKYWIITGDVVTLMSQGQRDAVDAAELNASRDSTASRVDPVEAWERAAASVLLNEFNSVRQWLVNFQSATAGAATLAALKTAVAALPNMPNRTLAQFKTALRAKLGT